MKSSSVRRFSSNAQGRRVAIWAGCGVLCMGGAMVDATAAYTLFVMFALFSWKILGGGK
jgi:hypothetical protein